MMPKWLRTNSFILLSLAVNLLLFMSIPLLSHLSTERQQGEISSAVAFRKPTRVQPQEPLDSQRKPEPPKPKKMPRVPLPAGMQRPSVSAPRPQLSLNVPDFAMAPPDLSMGIASVAAAVSPRSEFDLSEVDTQPQLVRRINPVYPFVARQKELTGIVVVKFLVAEDGRVTQASVVEANPAQVFEQAALEAVRKWRFEAAQLDGETVATWMTVPIRFKMDQ